MPPELLMVPPELLFTMGVPEPPELLLVKTVPAPELLFVTDPAGEGAGAGMGPAANQSKAVIKTSANKAYRFLLVYGMLGHNPCRHLWGAGGLTPGVDGCSVLM